MFEKVVIGIRAAPVQLITGWRMITYRSSFFTNIQMNRVQINLSLQSQFKFLEYHVDGTRIAKNKFRFSQASDEIEATTNSSVPIGIQNSICQISDRQEFIKIITFHCLSPEPNR